MTTTLLIGSGVSYYSEIPGLPTITQRIISCENVGSYYDLNFYLKEYNFANHPIHDYIKDQTSNNKELIKLIELIDKYITCFYEKVNPKHVVNYEDYYYVLKQIDDSYFLEFENPAIYNLLVDLTEEGGYSDNKLKEITKEAIRLIECVVWQMIDQDVKNYDQFNIIVPLINSLNLKNLLSLNHDLVLDRFLIENTIPFFDGFSKKHLNLEEWIGFESEIKDKIKYCKLHGSVDWFDVEVQLANHPLFSTIVKVPRGTYPDNVIDLDTKILSPNDYTPKLLIGTFNKMLGYLTDIFETLYDEFKNTLLETNILIISGYGFGDKGINTRLSHWLQLTQSKKMIIIHPNREDLNKSARGNAIIHIINKLNQHQKVRFIEKRFEDVNVNIEEIIKLCES